MRQGLPDSLWKDGPDYYVLGAAPPTPVPSAPMTDVYVAPTAPPLNESMIGALVPTSSSFTPPGSPVLTQKESSAPSKLEQEKEDNDTSSESQPVKVDPIQRYMDLPTLN